MELNKEQKEKLKNKLISFCDELGDIVKDKGVNLSIDLYSNYNTYDGLVFKVRNNYFGYETDETRFVIIHRLKDNGNSDTVYNNCKYKNDYINYYKDFMLDILMNKNRILNEVKRKINNDSALLDKILG